MRTTQRPTPRKPLPRRLAHAGRTALRPHLILRRPRRRRGRDVLALDARLVLARQRPRARAGLAAGTQRQAHAPRDGLGAAVDLHAGHRAVLGAAPAVLLRANLDAAGGRADAGLQPQQRRVRRRIDVQVRHERVELRGRGGRAGGRRLRGGGVEEGGEPGRALDAERLVVPGRRRGVEPQARRVVDVLERVVDAAVRGLVPELQRHVLARAHLVAQVEAGVRDGLDARLAHFGEAAVRAVVDLAHPLDVDVEQVGRVEARAARAGRGLHGPGGGAPAGDDGARAALGHHLDELGAAGRAEAVGEEDDVARVPGLGRVCVREGPAVEGALGEDFGGEVVALGEGEGVAVGGARAVVLLPGGEVGAGVGVQAVGDHPLVCSEQFVVVVVVIGAGLETAPILCGGTAEGVCHLKAAPAAASVGVVVGEEALVRVVRQERLTTQVLLKVDDDTRSVGCLGLGDEVDDGLGEAADVIAVHVKARDAENSSRGLVQ